MIRLGHRITMGDRLGLGSRLGPASMTTVFRWMIGWMIGLGRHITMDDRLGLGCPNSRTIKNSLAQQNDKFPEIDSALAIRLSAVAARQADKKR